MFAATALSLLLLQPSIGDPDVDCILGRVPPAQSAQMAAQVLNGVPSARRNTDALTRAAQLCAQERGWDGDTAGTFAGLALSVIIGTAARERLEAARIDPGVIDRWFDAQSAAMRTRMSFDRADGDRLSAALAASGVAEAAIDANATLIGTYIGVAIMLARVEQGLPIH